VQTSPSDRTGALGPDWIGKNVETFGLNGRQPHLVGALGAALLRIARKRKWVVEDLDSRALSITSQGRREILKRFAIQLC